MVMTESQNTDPCTSPQLVSVEQATEQILSQLTPVSEIETVDLLQALHRVLAEDLHSAIDVPGYDNSAMDGYAVRSDDCGETGVTLPVSQRIAAGSVGTELAPESAARIFTGAPIPKGADAVVMQEMCERDGDSVVINTTVKPGANIRLAGEDICHGSTVLSAGNRLRPQELGLLASVGLDVCPVKRKLKVAIFFTGDEIVAPGTPLQPGQIYNSNRYTLRGLLQAMDCDVIDLGIVSDTLESTVEVLQQAASQADVVITSGGVSVGEEDYVRIALQQIGQLSLWRIAMKPGKPVAYGSVDKAVFMGLPGNPVSVFVTFLVFAAPAIRKLQGLSDILPKFTAVQADFDWPAVKRQEYLRVKLVLKDSAHKAQLYPHQGSGVLSSASWADGLAVARIDQAINKGDMLDFMSFEGLI